jgi:hypothetical protein
METTTKQDHIREISENIHKSLEDNGPNIN